MNRRGKGTRVAVFVGVVLLVVGLTAAVSYAVHPIGGPERTSTPEYDTSAVLVEPIPATGAVSVDLESADGVVVIDRSHRNRFDGEDIEELENALVGLGYEVRYHDQDDDLAASLSQADAFVVIDPAAEYAPTDVDTVEAFVDQGGRLLMFGEPTRGELQVVDLFATDIVSVRSEIDSLSARFGFSYGADYLYNMNENDGNYRNILVRSPEGASQQLSHLGDVERGAMYTATYVENPRAEPVLVGAPGTVRSESERDDREYVVAAVDGDVMAVGDASFLSGESFNVADNQQFIAALIEFLATGNREPGELPSGDDPDEPPAENDGTGPTDQNDNSSPSSGSD